jgi:hypothetical protein
LLTLLLGLTHLQFEAMLPAAGSRPPTTTPPWSRCSGLRVFEATGADLEHLGEVHGHRGLRVHC